jgi:hypothetical protein
MKLTNRQLLNSVDSLTQLNTLKLPVKTSFRIAKLSRAIDDVLKAYRDTLKNLQEEHAERDEVGEKVVVENQISFKDPVVFDSAFQELLDCETDVPIKQISIGTFGSVEVEPKLLYHLDWLLKD